jgi:hypothetical protein
MQAGNLNIVIEEINFPKKAWVPFKVNSCRIFYELRNPLLNHYLLWSKKVALGGGERMN